MWLSGGGEVAQGGLASKLARACCVCTLAPCYLAFLPDRTLGTKLRVRRHTMLKTPVTLA